MNLRYTFTSSAQTDSAEWCAEQTVIALGVLSTCVVFGFIYTEMLNWHYLDLEWDQTGLHTCTHPFKQWLSY